MTHTKVPAVWGAVFALTLVGGGCATKKHVREAIAPVQNQVNDVQKQAQKHEQAIGDLDRQVATADEKATDAGKRASAAAESAATANSAANVAKQQADAANAAAQQAQQGASQVGQKLDQSLQNLDNYKLTSTEQVFFKSGKSNLSKEDKDKLDAMVGNLANQRNIIVEIEGYADRTGSRAFNAELSRKRADSVVHYLTVEHNVPLRNVRVLGVGSDFPDADNKTREARAQNRRVDVKVYALDVNGPRVSQMNPQQGSQTTPGGQADRMRQGTPTPRPQQP